ERNNKRRRAKRRNEEGLTKKQQELKILQDKIKILKSEGLTNRIISERLSIPLKTLERHITKMKKSNQL
ncbi:MAG: DNA-binding response regulator, partial [Paeniclostridium sordellii]|nr:DNA-binding response regulator [Paeniclostridium sordellii]